TSTSTGTKPRSSFRSAFLIWPSSPARCRTAKIVPFEEDDAPYLHITSPVAGWPVAASTPPGRPPRRPPPPPCSSLWGVSRAPRAAPLRMEVLLFPRSFLPARQPALQASSRCTRSCFQAARPLGL